MTPLRGVEIDEKQIVSSTGALALEKVPEHLIVIGGGVIGLELGSVWRRLGAKVTVVEFLDRIVATMDAEIGAAYQKILGKQGIEFKLGTKVTAAKKAGGKVTLTLEPAKGGATEELIGDVVLVSIGRRPYVDGLALEFAGVKLDDKGRVAVDDHFRTNVPGIYAIGDVIHGPMLAHKAEEEGVALAEMLAGQAGHVNYETCPNIVYTWPELASVGKTEEELKAAGVAIQGRQVPVPRQLPRQGQRRHRRHGEAAGRRHHRPPARRAHPRPGSRHADPRNRHGDGIRRLGRRRRPRLPRPPDA